MAPHIIDEAEASMTPEHAIDSTEERMLVENASEEVQVALESPTTPTEVQGGDDMDSVVLATDQMPAKERDIKVLPNEILDQIFAQFDKPPPSNSKLLDEPTFDLTCSAVADLKSSSLVCQRWRRLVVPILFKHTRLIIRDPVIPKPIMRHEYLALLDFVRRHKVKSFIASFVLCIRSVDFYHTFTGDFEFRSNDFSDFWTMIFEQMDPLDVTIVCSPQVLGALTSCEVRSTHSSSFEMPYHLLQLRRPALHDLQTPGDAKEQQEQRAPPRPSVLFEIRPWTILLLNEGSFIRSYRMFDFHMKQPPSILDELIGDNVEGVQQAMIPQTIRDFSYIAVFPTSTHFHKVTRNCPRLDRMYCQFVPRSDVLKDSEQMDCLDQNDMWLERNSCYAYVMRELFSSPPSGNYRFLKYFESGDAADIDAWEMAVEYVKRAGGGWRVEKTGVFMKDMEVAKKMEGADKNAAAAQGQEEVPSLFQGQLQRWAFDGVTALPVSSLSLYFRPQGWQGQD